MRETDRLGDTKVASKIRPKMSVEDRAKQFMPFAALKGFQEALALKEKIIVDKIELSEEMVEEIDRNMHMLKRGEKALVVYYYKGEYLKMTGMVSKIDENSRYIQIVDTKIPFDDILSLSLI